MYARAGAAPPVSVTFREHGVEPQRHLSVLRHADAADRTAGARDLHGGLDGRQRADALEHGMRAVAAGQFPDAFDALLAALGDHVGGAEFAAQIGAVGVPAHQDDPLGPEPLGGQHAAQSDRPVADHGHRVAGLRRPR